MVLWLSELGLSEARKYFMLVLLGQLTNVNWPTYNSYVYSPDFMNNGGVTYVNGVETPIPSACAGGPSGELPEFDFLVIGSGPGGAVVANKLALQWPDRTVVVIEAGPEAPVNVVAPGMFPFGFGVEAGISIPFHANKSPNYGNAYPNGVKLDVGRALGGTSNLNAMVYVCGVDEDYNEWARVTGDDNWNYTNMLPYIKSNMNMRDQNLLDNPECKDFYGTGGSLNLTAFNSDNMPMIQLLQYASSVAGWRQLPDYNCGKWTGFSRLRGTIDDGERISSAKAFLAPLRDRKNLMILRNAFADKIITVDSNGKNKTKVRGVLVATTNSNCPSFELRAKREIIVSGGSQSTPLILQRSGIGRAADLEPFNIPQKLDLNVGGSFKDHILSVHPVLLPGEPLSEEQMKNETQRYFAERKGLFSYLSSADLDAFLNVFNSSSPHPNNQWAFLTFAKQQSEIEQILGKTFEFKQEYVDQLVALNHDNTLMFFVNVVMKPKSTGHVNLRSTSPFDEPNINANFLSNDEDVRVLLGGVRKFQEFMASPIMAYYGARFGRISIDECNPIAYDTEAYWRCWFRYFTHTLWHPTGTAKMGKPNDPTAVVDSRLRVIGVQGKPGLRVSDGSPIPDSMSGNTQCPIYSLAARAAAMIIEDNQ